MHRFGGQASQGRHPILVMAAIATCVLFLGGPASASAPAPVTHSTGNPQASSIANDSSALGWTSSNWSGYAVTAGPYTSVTGTWTVPTVTSGSNETYSSTWVGIDGFNSSNLIQTGTEQDYYDGATHYSAWWEIVPAPAVVISSMTIHPGDIMSATIARNPTGGMWTITLTDTTTGETFSTVQAYDGAGTSAEWIHEAPTVGTRTAALAPYSATTFGPVTANGRNPRLAASNGGAMVQNGIQVSTPSIPGGQLDRFKVQNAGSPGASRLSARTLSAAGHGIKLTWTAATANGSPVVKYRIYRGLKSGGETLIATVGNVRSYIDMSNSKNRTSFYRVVAVNGVGAGKLSNGSSAYSR